MVAPGPELLPPSLAYVGAALLVAGTALNAWALRAFARRGTPMDPEQVPTALVEDGPYRFTRNPMYVAGVIILIGLVLLFAEARSALVLPLYVWLVARRFVPSDERRMATLFGDAWNAYARRVRRWL